MQADSRDKGAKPNGEPKNLWYAQWRGEGWHQVPTPPDILILDTGPYTLAVDFGQPREMKGFIVTVPDTASNGDIFKVFSNALKNFPNDYEVYVTDDVTKPGNHVKTGNTANRIDFAKPKTGRYFILKLGNLDKSCYTILPELEIELFCDSGTFKAKSSLMSETEKENLRAELNNPDPERFVEYVRLTNGIRGKARFDVIAAETFLPEALILDGDCDPVDVVFRRAKALAADLQSPLAAGLTLLQAEVANTPVEDTAKRFALFTKICELRRQIAFSNPLLDFKELLFVTKHRATINHMCYQYEGINIPPGGGVFVMDFDTKKLAAGLAPTVKNLLANATVENGRLAGKKLTSGSFLSPDISYDAKKLAFAYVECEGDKA
ncbi:MAG: hypothetical protein LBN39_01520 [Planctomycetaceae bacterium]|nr:hypothetical protein [Planctomycetaceae bacterium]